MTQTARTRSALPWLIFAGCCVLSFVGYGLIVNTSGLYFPSLMEEFGVAKSAVSLPVTLRDLLGALALSVAGVLLKRLNLKVLLSASVLICGLSFIACSMLTAVWQFDILFAIIGISMVIPVMLAPAVLLSNWFKKRLGLVMGIALGLSGIGGAVLNPVVAAIIKDFGWRTGYMVSGVILLVLILPFTIFILKFRPDAARGEVAYGQTEPGLVAKTGTTTATRTDAETPTPESETSVAARAAFRTPTFIVLVVSMILLQIISGFVQHVSNFESGRGLSIENSALVVTGIMLGAAAGKASIGVLLDRFRAEIVIAAYVIISVLGWVGVWLIGNAAVAVGAGFLSGLGQGYLLVAIPWMIRKSFGPRDYSEILSFATMFSNITLALAITLHSSLFDVTGSYSASFVLVVAVYLIAMVSGLWAYKKRPVHEFA